MTVAKSFLLAVIIVGLMYATVTLRGEETVYERIETLEVETPVEQLPAWQTDAEAIKAAQDVIKKKELQAELSVLEVEVTERKARMVEIEKELGTY